MCHYGNAWCQNRTDGTHECPPPPRAAQPPLAVVGEPTTHNGYSDIIHTVTFDRELTKAEFGDWLEAHGWLGYHPAGYGGWWTVKGNVGRYEHYRSTGD